MGHVNTFRRFCLATKRRLGADKDLVMPVLGEEGSGKSTLAFKIGRILDPTFTADRHQFAGPLYVRQMRRTGPYRVGVWDEMTEGGLRIRTQTEEAVEALKFVIESRGLNQVHLLCIPYAELGLKYLMNKRAPWRAHCTRNDTDPHATAVFQQSQRWYNKDKDTWETTWHARFKYRFYAADDDPEWQRYLKKKDDWIRRGRSWEQELDQQVSQDREENAVAALTGQLEWLPRMIERWEAEYQESFPGHGGGLNADELKIRKAMDAHLANRDLGTD